MNTSIVFIMLSILLVGVVSAIVINSLCEELSIGEVLFLQKVYPKMSQVDMTPTEQEFMDRVYEAEYNRAKKCLEEGTIR